MRVLVNLTHPDKTKQVYEVTMEPAEFGLLRRFAEIVWDANPCIVESFTVKYDRSSADFDKLTARASLDLLMR